jgi:tetratricopeptide (TPR) repeat protein
MSKSFNNLGIVAERRGDGHAAQRWHARSIRLKAAAGDRPGLASAYNNLGALYWRLGDLQQAAAALSASLDLKRRLGNRWGEAVTLANLAEVHFDSGDLAECERQLAESEIACADVGNRSLLTEIRRLEAQLAQAQGDPGAASRKARAAIELAREQGDALREGVALRVLGEATGDPEALREALRLLDGAEDRAEADRARSALDALSTGEV